MQQVLDLALPFFGLIFIGWACGKWRRLPADGLAWLNFFIVWVSLPALFFQMLSRTPIEQLANRSFVVATTGTTAVLFAVSLAIGLALNRRDLREAAIGAAGGCYSNIGYMGPGLTASALGAGAAVPTALIFCFDTTLMFVLIPALMAIGSRERSGALATAVGIAERILLHPFILSTIAGIVAAAVHFHPPVVIDRMLTWLMQAAAPCALFAMGVTVGLRPLERIRAEIPLMLVLKLAVHPFAVVAVLTVIGGFDRVWVETALLMACLPPALNVYVLSEQYGTHVAEASTVVLIGTIASVATVTFFLYLVTQDLLPTTLVGL